MISVLPMVICRPIGTDVVGHVVSVEDPEAHWVCCICSWLFMDLVFRLCFDIGGIRSIGRGGLGHAVFVGVATVSVRTDEEVSSMCLSRLYDTHEQQPP
jgi:hypothetical protein